MLDLNLGAEPQGTQHHQLLFASFVHRLPELIEWTITYTSATIHHEVLSQKQRSQNYSKLYSHLPSFLFGICNDLFPSFQFFFELNIAFAFANVFMEKYYDS